uniref:Uncharacterized protein n=1 Tax=Branchiostoma floridae TaxID=7739 RepID=C3Y3E1_BRAFL|eukprot:XP_002609198.1 hypothetical protein BRAFLDRAFT_90651 [Branchiostoma floridae]
MKLKSGKKVSVLEAIKALDFEGRLSFEEEVKQEVDQAVERIQNIQKELGGIQERLTSIQTKVGTISGVKQEAKRLMESLEESDLTYEATEGKICERNSESPDQEGNNFININIIDNCNFISDKFINNFIKNFC